MQLWLKREASKWKNITYIIKLIKVNGYFHCMLNMTVQFNQYIEEN